MKRAALLTRLDRAAGLILVASFLPLAPHPARAQSSPQVRERRWVPDHIDLDLLPVAYVIRRGEFSVDGPMTMPPIGFPASTYSLYPSLQYGVAQGTQVAFGVAGADRLVHGGQAIFYNLGLQHVLIRDSRTAPALSIGGYGFLAPQNRHGGAVYLVASHQLTQHPYPRGIFVHGGLLIQTFANADSGTDARPFLGANYVWNRRLRFSADYRPRMSWEQRELYSLHATVLVYKKLGLSVGYRSNAYRTHPFVGLVID
jgi:hypothetical protein